MLSARARLSAVALALLISLTSCSSDTARTVLVDTITVDEVAQDIALHPDGKRLYIAGLNGVFLVDLVTGSTIEAIPFRYGPNRIVFSPDGRTAYVTEVGGEVAVLDASSSILKVVDVGRPENLAITSDGERILILDVRPDMRDSATTGSVHIMNRALATVLGSVTVGIRPSSAVITPDGSRAYIVNSASATVSIVDMVNQVLRETLQVPPNPREVAMTPDGTRIYIAHAGQDGVTPGSISIIDTKTNIMIQTLPGVSARPVSIANSPDGRTIFLVDANRGLLTIDTRSSSVTSVVATTSRATSLAVAPDGKRVYVSTTGKALHVFEVRRSRSY